MADTAALDALATAADIHGSETVEEVSVDDTAVSGTPQMETRRQAA